MKKVGIALVAAVALIGGAVTTAAPASADTGAVTDPTGDAPRRIDIQELRVANNTGRVRATLEVRDLRARGTFTLFWVSEDYQTGFRVRLKRTEDGLTVRFAYRPEIGWHATPCPDAEVSWAAQLDRITARVPQDCYPYDLPDFWIFGAYSRLGLGEDSLEDNTLQLDRG